MSLYKTRLEFIMFSMNLNNNACRIPPSMLLFPSLVLEQLTTVIWLQFKLGPIKFQIFVHTKYTARYGTRFSINNEACTYTAGKHRHLISRYTLYSSPPKNTFTLYIFKSFLLHLNFWFFVELFYQTRRSFVISNVALIRINGVSV